MYGRVLIKHMAAKCDVFFHYCNAKEISFYYFWSKICTKHEKTFTLIPFILLSKYVSFYLPQVRIVYTVFIIFHDSAKLKIKHVV